MLICHYFYSSMPSNISQITCGGIQCIFNCCDKLGACANSTIDCYVQTGRSRSSTNIPTGVVVLIVLWSVVVLISIVVIIYKSYQRSQQEALQIPNNQNHDWNQNLAAANNIAPPPQQPNSERHLTNDMEGAVGVGIGYSVGLNQENNLNNLA